MFFSGITNKKNDICAEPDCRYLENLSSINNMLIFNLIKSFSIPD